MARFTAFANTWLFLMLASRDIAYCWLAVSVFYFQPSTASLSPGRDSRLPVNSVTVWLLPSHPRRLGPSIFSISLSFLLLSHLRFSLSVLSFNLFGLSSASFPSLFKAIPSRFTSHVNTWKNYQQVHPRELGVPALW